MATARELTNPELRDLAGFDLTGAERLRLNRLGFVESRKKGQAYAHELTKDGWRAARDLLTSERPAGARTLGGALFVLMSAFDAGLDRQGLSPAEFFDSHAVRRKHVRPSAETGAEAVTDSADIESAIHKAYAGLAGHDGDWVGLAPLRARLGAFGRTDVDEALRGLAMQPGVHIIPVANLKSLTQEDRDAALRLGGEENHAIAIESR